LCGSSYPLFVLVYGGIDTDIYCFEVVTILASYTGIGCPETQQIYHINSDMFDWVDIVDIKYI